MNVFRSLSLATRKLSIVITIILLVSLSLFLYYFKYIPANRERLQRQGFLILRQQQSGILQNLEDLKNYFCVQKKLFVEERNKKGISSNFFYKEYKDRPLNYNLSYRGKASKETSEAGPCNPSVFFDPDTISFRFYSATDSIEFKIPLSQLFERILDPVKAHFFQYHFVVCKEHLKALEQNNVSIQSKNEGESVEKKAHILYYSHGLAVSEEMGSDTLGNIFTSSQFSKIIDLEMNGSSYKAFMLPFQMGHNTLILTGLMPGIEYRERLQNIPFSTVNAIIIVFIFILISLPYIKVFFISPEEHFGIRDIVLLGTTLFAGTAIFLIILQQGLMQTGARLRTKESLETLSKNINQRFRNDISQAYTELKYLDSSLAKIKLLDSLFEKWKKNKVRSEKDSIERLFTKEAVLDSIEKWKKKKVRFEKKSVEKKLFIKEKATDSGYILMFPETNSLLNYIVHWTDSSGQQMYKGLFSDTLHSFLDISNRQYFKDVKTKHLYSFSDSFSNKKIDSFTIQPVYSMSTNSFEVNIAVPGKAAKMAALSAYFNSVMNTILPRGYEFYIIDNKGLIQFQSQGVVTLQENFLEWINDKQNLINTIRNRQSRYVADQYIDDRQFSLFIRPIDQLPLHIVVYHCNDFTTASILHINAFVLSFLFFLFIMLLVFCFIAWNKTNQFSKLNQPIYQYEWIIPALNKSRFFLNAILYLLIYIFFTFCYSIFVHRSSTLWLVGVISPLFTVWTLYILFRLHIHLKGDLSFKEMPRRLSRFLLQPYNLTALIFLLLLNVIYFRIEYNPVAIKSLVFYEIISLLLIPTAILFSQVYDRLIEKKLFSKLSKDKMPLYNFFWFFSVIAISIIPVTCFFIYAQQKENNLLIKAQQLDMAENIETRLSKLDGFEKVLKKRDISDKQRAEFFFTNGVYDNGCVTVKKDTKPFSDSVVSEPYEQVIRSISWGYRSLDNILSGQDVATDRKWYRDDLLKLRPGQMTLIYKLNSENKNADFIGEVNSLEIKCSTTTIFKYFRIDNPWGIFIIVVFSLLLLWVFFRLIQTITGRLFHSWNLKDEKMLDGHKRNMVRNQLIKKEYDEYNGIEEVLTNNEANAGVNQILRKLLRIPLPCLPDDPDIKYQSLKKVWEKEYEHIEDDKTNPIKKDDVILYNQYHLSALYENLWNQCSKEEKYFLYDMARDGFVNYKRAHLVQQLLYKGLLMNYNNKEELKIMSVSFRNYILDKGKTEEVIKLKEEFHVHGTWSKLRTPVLITITAIGTFLFITQEDIFQRVAALVPTISALLGLGALLLGSKAKQGAT